jgi:hypothetical protein
MSWALMRKALRPIRRGRSSVPISFLRESAAEVKAYFNLRVLAPRTVLGEKLPIK